MRFRESNSLARGHDPRCTWRATTVHAAESNWFMPPQKSPEKGPKACALLRFLGRNGMEPLPSLGQHRHGKKLSKIKIWMSLHQSRLKGLAFILRSFCTEQALAGSRKNSYVPLLAECDYGFGEITSSRFCFPDTPRLCVTNGWANSDPISNRLQFWRCGHSRHQHACCRWVRFCCLSGRI